jgi:ribonuclease HI
MEKHRINIYTDGASSPHKTKSGGWAAIVIFPKSLGGVEESKLTFSGACADTTNNRMELTAVLKGITLIYLLLKKALDKCEIFVYTDSMYVVNGCTVWRDKWEKENQWSSVKNLDLWRKLHGTQDLMTVNFIHVKGHSGNQYNEEADKLAVGALKTYDTERKVKNAKEEK